MTTDITTGAQVATGYPSVGPGRRRLLAVCLPLAAVLLAVGEATFPKGLDNPAKSLSTATSELAVATAHVGQFYTASLLVMVGLAVLGLSFSGIASLVGERGRTLATVVAVLGWFTTLCGVVGNTLTNYALAGAAAVHPASAVAGAIWVSEDSSSVTNVLLILYFFGLMVTVALTAVALWRSRAVPRTVAVAFALSFYLADFTNSPGLVSGLLPFVPFAAVAAYLATRIWRRA